MALASSPAVIRRDWKPHEILRFREGKRPVHTSPGAWISDFVSLGKSVVLCFKCAHKFDPSKVGYERVWHGSKIEVNSRCDGCKTDNATCYLYVKEIKR